MGNPFLSIIIPVYNTEKYIAECLDSCLDQDIPTDEYEIICVDDGSFDSSPEILQDYSSKNSNVKVITQKNGGVSVARNTGLSRAGGDYIWFVDADDLISPNILGKMKEHVISTPCERLVFHNIYVFREKLSKEELVQFSSKALRSNQICGDGVVWSSWLKKKYIEDHGIRFREGVKYGEDLLFVYEFNCRAKNQISINDVVYVQRLNSNSAVANSGSRRSVESDYRGAVIMKAYYDAERVNKVVSDTTCDIYCHFVRNAMYTLANAPIRTYISEVKRFRDVGIWPVVPLRSYHPYPAQVSPRNDLFCKMYNGLYRKAYTVHGAILLRMLVKTRSFLKTLKGNVQ